ncbi:hypothetical protein CAF53_18640 [Sphingobium sp. LB126]|nr:hypothetical protein CAF53_18640 [Sphingobium sp. LB126]
MRACSLLEAHRSDFSLPWRFALLLEDIVQQFFAVNSDWRMFQLFWSGFLNGFQFFGNSLERR